MGKMSFDDALDVVNNMLTLARLCTDSEAFNEALEECLSPYQFQDAQDHLRAVSVELELLKETLNP